MLCSREGKLVFLVGVAALTDIKEHQPLQIKWDGKCVRYRTSIFFSSVLFCIEQLLQFILKIFKYLSSQDKQFVDYILAKNKWRPEQNFTQLSALKGTFSLSDVHCSKHS